MSSLSIVHERYSMQAQWTKPFREFILDHFLHNKELSVLEVGCGTGAILDCIKNEYEGNISKIVGIDIDLKSLKFNNKNNNYDKIQCSGENLPFRNNAFDLVFCHFFLMWVSKPVKVLKEMKRVTKNGGVCTAMAEPCYSEIVAEPDELLQLSYLQINKLREAGADINTGSKIYDYFLQAGFTNVKNNKYKTGIQNKSHLENEIKQILIDCKMDRFNIKISNKTKYNVPTYYAYATK